MDERARLVQELRTLELRDTILRGKRVAERDVVEERTRLRARIDEVCSRLAALGPVHHDPVVTLDEFRAKWGSRLPGIVVCEFIRRAPGFAGKTELAIPIGEMIADLEAMLKG